MNGRLLGSRPVYASPSQSSRTTEPHKPVVTIQPQHATPERNQTPRREKKMLEKMSSRVQAQTGEIFMRNIDYSVDDEFLLEYFQPFGSVIRAKVIMKNGRSRGRGFVEYSTPDEARNAIEVLNGKILGGRPLHMMLTKTNEQHKASFAWTQRVQPYYRPCVAPATR